jgi:hypothetical protein
LAMPSLSGSFSRLLLRVVKIRRMDRAWTYEFLAVPTQRYPLSGDLVAGDCGP